MADESIVRMNLSAIKKIDPYAKEIVDSSSHVAFYTFNSDINEWEKTDVEGAFFIYHRNAEPFHSIFINNRLNTSSFVEPITGCLELQSQPPFLLYRNKRSRIRGFWFYNSEECDRISNLVNGLLQTKENNSEHAPLANLLLSNPKPSNASIFNMLSKAQQEYNAQLSSPQQQNSAENATPCNVLKFFESAKQATADAQFTRVQPLSVDELEKQQRAATPNDGPTTTLSTTKNGDIARPSECRLSPFQPTTTVGPVASVAATIAVNSPKPFSLLSERDGDISAPPKSALVITEDAEQCLRRLLVGDQLTHSDPKPALMPPTMFDAPPNATTKPKLVTQPLNPAQFVQALTHLMQTDMEFVNKLHKAYLKSCSNDIIDTSTTYH